MAALANQPQTIGKLLDNGFKFYLSTLKQVLPLSFLVSFIPISILIGLVGFSAYSVLLSGEIANDPEQIMALLVTMIPGIIGAGITYLILYIGLYYKMAYLAQGDDAALMDAVKLGAKAFFPLLLASILYSLAMMLGLVLLIIPGLIIMVNFILYFPTYIMGKEGAVSCLGASNRLVWGGNWWRTAIVITVPIVIMLVFDVAVQFLVSILQVGTSMMGDPGTGAIIFQLSMDLIVQVIITPLMPAFGIVLYWDLKLRKEGGDLQAQISAQMQNP